MKFYISDLHFGHKNILKFDNRPFFTLEEMEKTLISNWNNKISKNDDVYILGDMFWHNEDATRNYCRILNSHSLDGKVCVRAC